jgi:oxalate decarboxylase/phosphoglucose isomerase-like protein (cupin superfamily)
MEAGSVGWLDAVDISKGHSVGNTGDATLDFVLVTIK